MLRESVGNIDRVLLSLSLTTFCLFDLLGVRRHLVWLPALYKYVLIGDIKVQ